MKKVEKTLLGLLAIGLCAPLSGCGSSGEGVESYSEDTSTGQVSGSLTAEIFEAGFGSKYIQNVMDGFMKKNPGAKVKLVVTNNRSTIDGDLDSGTNQKYGLFFLDSKVLFKMGNTPHYGQFTDYEEPLTDLSDVYNYKNPGESKTIAEKFNQGELDYVTQTHTINGQSKQVRYLMNYGVTPYGFAYNKDIVAPYLTSLFGGELPRTTDELATLCAAIQKDGQKPIIFSGYNDYWNQVYWTWFAQYSSLAQYNKFYTGKVYDEDSGKDIYSSKIYEDLGRLRSFQECDRFLDYENGYIDKNSNGYQFMTAQNRLFTGSAAIMANGGWLENEMKSAFTDDSGVVKFPHEISMMRIPVISKITEKAPSITSDANLSKIIKDIDDGKSYAERSVAEVTEADFAYVSASRKVMHIAGEGDFAVVPANSPTIAMAKAFLKYMYSDEGIQIYTNSCSGCFLPLKDFDYSTCTTFQSEGTTFLKEGLKNLNALDWCYVPRNLPIVYDGDLDSIHTAKTIEKSYASPDAADRLAPQAMYETAINYYQADNGSAWNDLLTKAGLK
jgi:hypothetical protein